MLAHKSGRGMRLLRHLRQLPLMALGRKNRDGAAVRVTIYFRGVRAPQPFENFTFAKSPLPAELDRGNFLALGPKANRARRNTQPFGDRSGCEQRFTLGLQLLHRVLSPSVCELSRGLSRRDEGIRGNLISQFDDGTERTDGLARGAVGYPQRLPRARQIPPALGRLRFPLRIEIRNAREM